MVEIGLKERKGKERKGIRQEVDELQLKREELKSTEENLQTNSELLEDSNIRVKERLEVESTSR